jgi:short-subunit dehydrogenase involved in D-alanine esterification of teichoic acids
MIHNAAHSDQTARTLIVTGASSGIGHALSRQLANRGVRVVAVGRDRERLETLARSCPPIRTEAFDLATGGGGIDALAARLIAAHGPIHGIVNNAAVQDDVRIDDSSYTAAQIEREIAVNLTAPVLLVRALLAHLLAQSAPIVVNIGSGLAFVPKRTSAVYSATKAGLHLFTEALRVQTRGSRLAVVEAVMPLVDTAMTQGRGSGKISAEAAAAALIAAMDARRPHAWIGRARLLPPLLRLAPSLAQRILQRT